jgi:hypothetical protein
MALGAALSGEPANPAGVLDQRMTGAVRTIMRIPAGRGQPSGRVLNILGGAPREAFRQRCGLPPRRQFGSFFAIPVGFARQRRIGVDPAFLEADPAGPQIAFLDDMQANATCAHDRDRQAMHRPAIAEKDHVGDPSLRQQPVEECRPIIWPSAIVDRARQTPKQPVAAVEIDPMDGVAVLGERLAEPVEKPRGQPLQKQERARRGHHTGRTRPGTPNGHSSVARSQPPQSAAAA